MTMRKKLPAKHIFLVLLLGFSLIFSCTSVAQFSVSQRTFKKLGKVEKLMQEKSYQEALKLLADLQSSTRKKYELALIHQALGYLFYESNEHKNAIENFEKSLQLDASPEPVLQSIRFNLVQLYAITDNYQKAIHKFDEWIKKESSPSGDRLALGGSLYAQMKQYDTAVSYLQKAIASTKKPQESWYRTLLSVYFQQENYQPASELLQKLIILHPSNSEYWKQLYTSYYLLNDHRKALSTLELAFSKGLVTEEQQITNLAKLYLHQGTPLKAAKLLDNEFNNNRIQKSDDNLRLLATAYQRAKETTKAAEIYLQLARSTNNTDLQLQAARLYVESRQWQKVISALENLPIKRGTEQALIMKGVALVELGNVKQAAEVFRKAREYASTRTSAKQWLEFLSTQQPDTLASMP